MITLRAAEVAQLCGGVLAGCDPEVTVSGPVVTDSRGARPGALFVAIEGHRVDGRSFAPAAVQAGAVLVLADRALPDVPTVVVPDVVPALGRLAAGVRARLTARVVGITGSVGKTGTKDLLAGLLERCSPPGSVVATAGSFNNEIGLPLTLLGADGATRFLVLELGARGAGHIAELAAVARPQVGLVLNVGSAHLGEFGSREAVATAKGELVESLPSDGLAVLNADDPLVAAMASRTRAPVLTFGRSPAADVRATGVTTTGGRASFVLEAEQGTATVSLTLVGEHHVEGALAAAAVALSCGCPLAEVAAGLSAATARSRWRMEVTERPDGVTVVNDAYNANPESMAAALRATVELAGGRRTWAVLGEMRELGPSATAEHEQLGRLAVRLGVRRLLVVGEGARTVHLGAGLEGAAGDRSVLVPDVGAAIAVLDAEVEPGDVVLVKASRAAGLERVAEALLEEVTA